MNPNNGRKELNVSFVFYLKINSSTTLFVILLSVNTIYSITRMSAMTGTAMAGVVFCNLGGRLITFACEIEPFIA